MNAVVAMLVVGLFAAGVCAQDVDDEASLRRCKELAALQDRGALTIPLVVAALADADDHVARVASAIVRHEWAELPAALFAAVDDNPQAARVLLREFALGPRPAASAWASDRVRALAGRRLDDRLLALAARGTPPATAEFDLVFEALAANELGDGYACVLHTLAPKHADAMVGRLHQSLLQGKFPSERAWALCDRMSEQGIQALLATVVSLPAETVDALLTHVAQRSPELVLARVATALDGDEALAPWVAWLRPALDRPARVDRVAAFVLDAAMPDRQRSEAAVALLEATTLPSAVLDFVAGEPDLRRHALDVAIDRLPVARLLAWLDEGPGQRKAVVRALQRRQTLEPQLEKLLVADLEDAGNCDGEHGIAAAMVLVERGSAPALQRLLPLLRRSSVFFTCMDRLGHRRDPFAGEVLLTELVTIDLEIEAERRQEQLDAVALALAARGDRREQERLVQRAPQADPAFVRRCAHHVRPLAKKHAVHLLDQVAGRTADAKAMPMALRSELLAWAATAADDEVVRLALVGFWREPVADDDGELQDIVVRALADTPFRATLVDEVRAAIATGPLPENLRSLPFELLGSMPTPLGAVDLDFCADLVLRLPRTDPERERELMRRWPDGATGFPMVVAVAACLRNAAPAAVGATFTRAVADALADPNHRHIARARLAVLWRELAHTPAVQQAVAAPTAELWLRLPEQPGSEASAGAAHLFVARAAIARGEYPAAAAAAEAARAGFLRLSQHRRHARVLLGERDPAAGNDPWAALAALPHWCRQRDAAARGDHAAANVHAGLVREFAGHDVSLLAGLPATPPEIVR